VDGGVDRKVAKVAEGRKEEGVSEDGFSEGRKPAEGGLESKEYRSSVGFFDFVRFVVSWVEEGLAQRRKDAKVERGGKSGAGDLQPQKGEKLAEIQNSKHSHPAGTRNLDPCFS
jgi:hypothetical protein